MSGGGSQNHLKSYLRVLKTVTKEEAYKGGQKLQTYHLRHLELWVKKGPTAIMAMIKGFVPIAGTKPCPQSFGHTYVKVSGVTQW